MNPPWGGGVSSEVKYLRDFWTNFVDLRISVHKGFVSTNRRRRRKNTGFGAKQSRFASTNRLWSAEKSLPSTAPLARHHHDLMLDSLQWIKRCLVHDCVSLSINKDGMRVYHNKIDISLSDPKWLQNTCKISPHHCSTCIRYRNFVQNARFHAHSNLLTP